MDEAVTPDVLRLARLIAASGFPADGAAGSERTEPYHVPEAARILGIHKATLYREIQRGHCRAYRIGNGPGAIRIPIPALAEYQCRIEANAMTETAPKLRAVTA